MIQFLTGTRILKKGQTLNVLPMNYTIINLKKKLRLVGLESIENMQCCLR